MARNVERAEARKITEEIEAAVAGIFQAHGLEFKPGQGCTYGEVYRVKLEAHAVNLDASGVNLADPKVADWNRYARGFGLPVEGLGKTFKASGKTFKVTGLNLRRRTRPVCAIDVATGKDYIFPADSAKAFLAVAGVTE